MWPNLLTSRPRLLIRARGIFLRSRYALQKRIPTCRATTVTITTTCRPTNGTSWRLMASKTTHIRQIGWRGSNLYENFFQNLFALWLNTQWISNDSKVSPQDLFEMATYGFWEMVHDLRIRFFQSDSMGKTSYNIDENNWAAFDKRILEVIEQRHPRFGKCWTISFPTVWAEYGRYYIKIGV